MLLGVTCAAGICLGAATLASFFNRKPKDDQKKKQPEKNRYWQPVLGRFIRSSTPLLFQPYNKVDDDKLEIAYLFQGTMVRVSCSLRQLLATYSSYLYHLYDTLNKDPILMQQQMLIDLKERFPAEHVAAIVAYLVRGDKAAIKMPAVEFFGIPSLLSDTPKLYEDWIEEQSEALHFHPHPFLQLDPLFDATLNLPTVVHLSTQLPKIEPDALRTAQRRAAYHHLSIPSTAASSGPPEVTEKSSLRDLAAIGNDYLACILYRGQYAYLQRTLTAWRTKSQFQRDPVAMHNLWIMQQHGVSILIPQPVCVKLPEAKFKSRRELIYYEAMQFLLGASSDLGVLWSSWQRLGQEAGGGGVRVNMPASWLGPPVLF